MYKTCDTCEHNPFCKTKLKCDICGKWEGWIPVKEEVPATDEYVLIQLTKEYSGDIDNIILGIYFPSNFLDNKEAQWYKGHITIEELDSNFIYAWRKLPQPIIEK